MTSQRAAAAVAGLLLVILALGLILLVPLTAPSGTMAIASFLVGLGLLAFAIVYDRLRSVSLTKMEFQRGKAKAIAKVKEAARELGDNVTVIGENVDMRVIRASDAGSGADEGHVVAAAGTARGTGEAHGTLTAVEDAERAVVEADNVEELAERLADLLGTLRESYEAQLKGIVAVLVADRGGHVIVTPEQIEAAVTPLGGLEAAQVILESLTPTDGAGPIAIQVTLMPGPSR